MKTYEEISPSPPGVLKISHQGSPHYSLWIPEIFITRREQSMPMDNIRWSSASTNIVITTPAATTVTSETVTQFMVLQPSDLSPLRWGGVYNHPRILMVKNYPKRWRTIRYWIMFWVINHARRRIILISICLPYLDMPLSSNPILM